ARGWGGGWPGAALDEMECRGWPHALLDKPRRREQHTAPNAMLAMDEHPPAALDLLVHPGRPLTQLRDGKGMGVARRQMEHGNILQRHRLRIVLVLRARIHDRADASTRQTGDVFGMNAAAHGEMLCHPAHGQAVRQ